MEKLIPIAYILEFSLKTLKVVDTVKQPMETKEEDDTFTIKVKTIQEGVFDVLVNGSMKILQLKELIHRLRGVDVEKQRLICRGKVLKDEEMLNAYKLKSGSTIHLVIRKEGPPPTNTSGEASASVGMGSIHIPTDQTPSGINPILSVMSAMNPSPTQGRPVRVVMRSQQTSLGVVRTHLDNAGRFIRGENAVTQVEPLPFSEDQLIRVLSDVESFSRTVLSDSISQFANSLRDISSASQEQRDHLHSQVNQMTNVCAAVGRTFSALSTVLQSVQVTENSLQSLPRQQHPVQSNAPLTGVLHVAQTLLRSAGQSTPEAQSAFQGIGNVIDGVLRQVQHSNSQTGGLSFLVQTVLPLLQTMDIPDPSSNAQVRQFARSNSELIMRSLDDPSNRERLSQSFPNVSESMSILPFLTESIAQVIPLIRSRSSSVLSALVRWAEAFIGGLAQEIVKVFRETRDVYVLMTDAIASFLRRLGNPLLTETIASMVSPLIEQMHQSFLESHSVDRMGLRGLMNGFSEEETSEWVRTIQEDQNVQQRMPSQRPFSDAYLEGVSGSSKKRKVSANAAVDVKEGLRKQIDKSVGENVADDLPESLVRAYERQMKTDLRKRVREDDDFDEKRFPTANRFLK